MTTDDDDKVFFTIKWGLIWDLVGLFNSLALIWYVVKDLTRHCQ